MIPLSEVRFSKTAVHSFSKPIGPHQAQLLDAYMEKRQTILKDAPINPRQHKTTVHPDEGGARDEWIILDRTPNVAHAVLLAEHTNKTGEAGSINRFRRTGTLNGPKGQALILSKTLSKKRIPHFIQNYREITRQNATQRSGSPFEYVNSVAQAYESTLKHPNSKHWRWIALETLINPHNATGASVREKAKKWIHEQAYDSKSPAFDFLIYQAAPRLMQGKAGVQADTDLAYYALEEGLNSALGRLKMKPTQGVDFEQQKALQQNAYRSAQYGIRILERGLMGFRADTMHSTRYEHLLREALTKGGVILSPWSKLQTVLKVKNILQAEQLIQAQTNAKALILTFATQLSHGINGIAYPELAKMALSRGYNLAFIQKDYKLAQLALHMMQKENGRLLPTEKNVDSLKAAIQSRLPQTRLANSITQGNLTTAKNMILTQYRPRKLLAMAQALSQGIRGIPANSELAAIALDRAFQQALKDQKEFSVAQRIINTVKAGRDGFPADEAKSRSLQAELVLARQNHKAVLPPVNATAPELIAPPKAAPVELAAASIQVTAADATSEPTVAEPVAEPESRSWLAPVQSAVSGFFALLKRNSAPEPTN